MLNFRQDLFARLATSAQKNTDLNKPFRVSHVDFHEAKTHFDKILDDTKTTETENIAQVIKKPVVEKIDEKVEKIISNSGIFEIQLDLEIAEQLLQKIKSADAHNPKIPLIEQTIYRLKLMLEQKN